MDDLPLSLERATDLLGLGPDAPADARQRLYEKKRILLERKLRLAATPGLRRRYRSALDELTRAYEMIEIAATDRDLLGVKPEPELVDADRAVMAGHILAPRAFGLESPGRPGRPKIRLDRMIAALAAAAILLIAGLGWWSAVATRAENERLAEIARLETARWTAEAEAAESARQKAAAEEATLRLQLERQAAEQARIEQRERDQRAELERRTRLQIAEVANHFEHAARRLASIEALLQELRTTERTLSPDAGWESEWVRLRGSLWDDHRRWLDEFLAQHPAQAKLRRARELLDANDAAGASVEAAEGVRLWEEQAAEVRGRRYRQVGRPLIDSALAARGWPPEAYDRVRRDEPDAVTQYVVELREALAYLDEPGRTAVPEDWRGRLQPLALLAGQDDRDFQRWQPRFVGELTIRSKPEGAWLADETGRALGRAPHTLRPMRGATVHITATLPGYVATTVQPKVGLDENQEVEIQLAAIPVPKPGQTFTIPELELSLGWVRPGTFDLGSPANEPGRSPEEGPQVRVVLTAGYWLGHHEVTQRQWTVLMGRNPSTFKEVGPDAPVENVSWKDAMEFGRRLTERERAAGRLPAGYHYTLPTEAQWEYACRAGTREAYAGELEPMAWYGASGSSGTTRPVGQKRPNAWGFHDMHGNVWEWCRDWFSEGYRPPANGRPLVDPEGPETGAYRVNRGGSWRSPALSCRSAFRHWLAPNDRGHALGFRLALVLEKPPGSGR